MNGVSNNEYGHVTVILEAKNRKSGEFKLLYLGESKIEEKFVASGHIFHPVSLGDTRILHFGIFFLFFVQELSYVWAIKKTCLKSKLGSFVLFS